MLKARSIMEINKYTIPETALVTPSLKISEYTPAIAAGIGQVMIPITDQTIGRNINRSNKNEKVSLILI